MEKAVREEKRGSSPRQKAQQCLRDRQPPTRARSVTLQDVSEALQGELDPNGQRTEFDLVDPPRGRLVDELQQTVTQVPAAGRLPGRGGISAAATAFATLGRTSWHEAVAQADYDDVRFLVESSARASRGLPPPPPHRKKYLLGRAHLRHLRIYHSHLPNLGFTICPVEMIACPIGNVRTYGVEQRVRVQLLYAIVGTGEWFPCFYPLYTTPRLVVIIIIQPTIQLIKCMWAIFRQRYIAKAEDIYHSLRFAESS